MEPQPKKPKIFDILFEFARPKQAVSSLDLFDEIAEYLKDEESDPVKMWTQTKRTGTRLSDLARRTFCVPATSASSERTFSKSGILMSPLKSKTSSKTLELRTFLKSNFSFVENPVPVKKTVQICGSK